jgi:hypothetical protein
MNMYYSQILGGLLSMFLEHLSTEKLVEYLVKLQTRLADLGLEYRNERVFLAGLLEETTAHDYG